MKSNQKPQTQAEKNRDRLKQVRDKQLEKKSQQIDLLSGEDLLTELKNKQLPTFGTNQERKDRLKKFHGINPNEFQQIDLGGDYQEKMEPQINKQPLQQQQQNNINQQQQQQQMQQKFSEPIAQNEKQPQKKLSVLENIQHMQQQRDERRQKVEQQRQEKKQREIINQANGRMVDADFDIMIEKQRLSLKDSQAHSSTVNMKISVCVRKRPIFNKEAVAGEMDSVSAANPLIRVHECKFKVDGITKFIENHDFTFDNTFSDQEGNDALYRAAIQPTIHFPFNKGIVTCFAYGQTGSGKTFTMKGSNEAAIRDIFSLAKTQYADKSPKFYLSFFEIYGGKLFDLLNSRAKLAVLEDRNQKIQIQGLEEKLVDNEGEMINMIEFAHSERTTHATASNDTSSRSHAICQIQVKEGVSGKLMGKLFLVDLAGSERAADCQSNNRQRRLEGAEINKSLLALKECIRSLDQRKNNSEVHIPFRASKLTMVLRDSFMMNADRTRIIMIACVSPGSSSADHTLNTLRYASRLKENPGQGGQDLPQSQPIPQFQQQPVIKNEHILPPTSQIQQQQVKPPSSLPQYQPPPQKQQQYPPMQQQRPPSSFVNQDEKPSGIRPRGIGGGNALANAGRLIMEGGARNNINLPPTSQNQQINKLPQEESKVQQPQRKQWGEPLAQQKQQNLNQKPPSQIPPARGLGNVPQNQQNKFRNEQQAIENVRMDNIKVRDNDGFDDDSDDSDLGNDRADHTDDNEKIKAQQRLKNKEKQDWNYLKSTLNGKQAQGGWRNQQMPTQEPSQDDDGLANDGILDLQEKVDTLLEKEEEMISQHMHLIKENAQLLTKEGELISYVQESDDYEIEEYVGKMESIIEKKLQIYKLLNMKLQDFKNHLKEEEDVHNMTVNKGFGLKAR